MGEVARRGSRDLVVYGLGQALGQVANFILVPYYVRVLTPTQYGAVALLAMLQLMLMPLVLWGADAALFRSFYDSDDSADENRVLMSSLSIVLGAGVVAVVLGWLLSPLLGSLWLADLPSSSATIALIFVAAAVRAPGQVAMSLLRAQRKATSYSVLSVASLMVRLGAIVVGVTVAGLGVLGFALGCIVGDLLATLLALWLVRSTLTASPTMTEIRRQLAFGTPVMVANLAALVLVGFDRFLIERMLGLDRVAVYALGYQIANLMMVLVVNPVQLVWPSIALPIRHRPDAPKLYADATLALLAGGLFVASLLTAWAPLLVQILAPDPVYALSALVVPFVSVANLMIIVQRFMAIGLEIDRTMNRLAVWFWVGAAIDVGLCFLLIPRVGILGAAAATLVSYVSLPLMALYLTRSAGMRITYASKGFAAVAGLSALVLVSGAGLMVIGADPWVVGVLTTTILMLASLAAWVVARAELRPLVALVRSSR